MTHSANPSRSWTAEQTQAIHTTGASILVSAAAGSGKTAVLAERCAQLVCDENNPVEVDELLVVTFTEQAAAEMKSRIAQAIHRRHQQNPTARLTRQLALVEQAQVSTLHSFCARILRRHFHLLELDPAFGVLDGDEAKLLRKEIAREMFDRRYEQETGGKFDRLIDYYGHGDDESIIQRLLRTHDLLRSLIDPKDWMDRARQTIADSIKGDFSKSPLGKQLRQSCVEAIEALDQQAVDCRKLIESLSGFDKYLPVLAQIQADIADWKDILLSRGMQALTEVFSSYDPPRLPSFPSGQPNKELAKGAMDDLKKRIKEGPLTTFLQFTPEQWQQGLRITQPYMELFLELVEEFDQRYAQAKREIRAVDFADLEQLSLRILRDDFFPSHRPTPSPIARMYHRQFKHVLVDEYQDINAVQDAILNLVSHDCLDRPRPRHYPPNLFCVGDIKQSIYRFRLADPKRFLDRHRMLDSAGTDGKIIHLQSNFRSRKPLLDAINALFSRLMTCPQVEIIYDHTHALVAGQTFPVDGDANGFVGAPIELHLVPAKDDFQSARDEDPHAGDEEDAEPFNRSDVEATLLAGRIRQMMGLDGHPRRQIAEKDSNGQWIHRPIQYRDIVILLQAVSHKAEHYARILRQHGIPVHADGGSGFFATTEIRDILSLLKLLDNLRQDLPMAALLRSPLANLPDCEASLARIRIAYPADDHPFFHEAVLKYADEQKDELAASLRDILGQVRQWRELARTRPLAELLWTIYETSGYLAFCSGMPNGQQRVANLIALHERARQFGRFQRQGLYRFLRFMDQLAGEDDPAQPSIWSAADDAVRIMTIHKSKGLEFPVVIVPDLSKAFNTEDQKGPILADRSAGMGLSVPDPDRAIRYPSLAELLIKQSIHRQMLAEQMRLLYVAMTRAKEHLILVGTVKQKTVQGWQALWADRTDLPSAAELLSARSMLDWIGPAACAIGKPHLELIQHAPTDLDAAEDPPDVPDSDESNLKLADLKPLDPPPPSSAEAQRVIDRLTRAYPHQPFTRLPATQSVTGWTKHAVTSSQLAGTNSFYSASHKLDAPRFTAPDSPPTATERGNATHLVLQYIDWTRPCIGDDLNRQIQSMLDRKLISLTQAALVDRAAIEWFISTDLAATLRQPGVDLRRELPFYLTCPSAQFDAPPSADPLDQVMVRGRMDLVVISQTSLSIVDYKTDRVTRDQVPARAALYEGQMKLYRQALSAIIDRPMEAMHLVFLTPRAIHILR